MNYVLFFPDEMRAENLACYGHTVARTPNYDRLASQGTLFENHYVQNPVCVGSRCSLLTGWYPHVNGFRSLLSFLTPGDPNFLKYLRDGGYNVQLYGKNHVFDAEALAQSVTAYESCGGSRTEQGSIWKDDVKTKQAMGRHLFADDYTMLFPPMDDAELEEMQDTRTVMRGVEFLDSYKKEDAPFFLFVSINNPHAPYVAPKHYYEMYRPEDFVLRTADADRQPSFVKALREYSGFDSVAPEVFQKCAAVYQGMVTYCDDMLGRILDALERNGLMEDTMVIATSDHGDFAGDYGLVEKWPNCFYDDLTKVPLIIRAPGGKPGHRVKGLVSEIDIMPTVMDYAGIPALHDHFGKTLRPLLDGAEGDKDAAVYCEGGYDPREPQCFEGTERDYSFLLKKDCVYYPKMMMQQEQGQCVCRGTMMRRGPYKLIVRSNGENEFYDLDADLGEAHNCYGDGAYEAHIRRMESDMLKWYVQTADVVRPLK